MARLISIEKLTMLYSDLVHSVGTFLAEVLIIVVKGELVPLFCGTQLAQSIVRTAVFTMLQHRD